MAERDAGRDAARDGAQPEPLAVRVEGIEGARLENVLAYLAIQRRRDTEPTEAEIRRMHGQAPEEIRQALQPFGHYHPTIDDELLEDSVGFTAVYRIEPGPVVELVEVDVRVIGAGAEDPVFRDAIDRFPLSEGDALLHEPYDRARLELEAIARQRGYFDARFLSRRIELDLLASTARIELHLDTGERFRFGSVRFVQDALEDDVLREYVPFETGEPFHQSLLMEMQGALADTDLFQFVEVDARPGEAEGQAVPIVVSLEPRQRFQYTLGIGYGTDTGTRGTAGLEVRRVNRRGHRLASEVQASFIRRTATLRYTIPTGGAGNEYALSAAWRDDDVATFRDRTVLLRASRSRGDRLGWREVLFVDLMRSDFRVAAVEDVTTLVIPGGDWDRTRSDDAIYPTRGHRLAFELRTSARFLGSDVSFLQGTVRAKIVRPVGASGRFLSRIDLGGTWVDDFLRLPASIRYFAGGDRSVRGFGFEQLGPPDIEGVVYGGRHLATASVEYEHLFGETWGAAVFYDAGNAVQGFDQPLGDWLEQGAGIGARWVSPIGLVRLDLATAVSRSGFPLRVHFRLGPDL